MPSIRILLLEDSPLDADQIWSRLVKGGLEFEIDRVETRDAFLEALETRPYDLILADYSLPSFDGLSALEIVHERTGRDAPFLFVSGGLGEEVAIETLKQGRDRLRPEAAARAARAGRPPRPGRGAGAGRAAAGRGRAARERGAAPADPRQHPRLRDHHHRHRGPHRRLERRRRASPRLQRGRGPGPTARPDLHPRGRRGRRPRAELATAPRPRPRRRRALAASARDGSRFWASGVVRPLLDEAGELHGFTKVVRDMTERKRAEDALPRGRPPQGRVPRHARPRAAQPALRHPQRRSSSPAAPPHARAPRVGQGGHRPPGQAPRPPGRRPARRLADLPGQDPAPQGVGSTRPRSSAAPSRRSRPLVEERRHALTVIDRARADSGSRPTRPGWSRSSSTC